jgi:hypothetical protein
MVEPGAPGQRARSKGRPNGTPRGAGKLPGEGKPPSLGVPPAAGTLPGTRGQLPVGAPGQVDPGAPGQLNPDAPNPWLTEDWDGVMPPSRPAEGEPDGG